MLITKGFQIEKPELFIPWRITSDELKRIFAGENLRQVNDGYFTTSCISLNGLSHELGFHFYETAGGLLMQFEFFRTSYEDQKGSFEEFQRHLVQTFGELTTSTPGSEGYPDCVWNIDDVTIGHSVYDRFGPEEHVRISKNES